MLVKIKTVHLKPLCLAIVMSLGTASTSSFSAENDAVVAQEHVAEQENPMSKLDWHMGPSKENIAQVASIQILKNEGFLDPQNADKFLELTDNLPTGNTNILVAADDSWWATFDFEPSGYVKDDEKIEADALLKQLQDSDKASNERRKELGLVQLHTIGWAVPPHYDTQTNQLEWALKLRDDQNEETINYTIRLLGRTGVMTATLVSDEEHLTENIQEFKKSLAGFNFNSGEKYSEYKDGDKVAKYGLAALITGGAAIVATKKGLWAAIAAFFAAAWKFIAVAAVAVVGWVSSLFKRKKP